MNGVPYFPAHAAIVVAGSVGIADEYVALTALAASALWVKTT